MLAQPLSSTSATLIRIAGLSSADRSTLTYENLPGGVQASTGVMLGTKINYFFFKQKSYKPMVSLWFNTYSQSTNNTSQDVNEIGLWYGFQLDL